MTKVNNSFGHLKKIYTFSISPALARQNFKESYLIFCCLIKFTLKFKKSFKHVHVKISIAISKSFVKHTLYIYFILY